MRTWNTWLSILGVAGFCGTTLRGFNLQEAFKFGWRTQAVENGCPSRPSNGG